ncbi:unnamed protein product [Acanthoscelides obtectus]|uniref:Peptidase M14 domain-containing protein n=1 Tax=Acanthoscelides obtectus TaxID=200917 RepID=A0A9P0JUU5_ACAOB|nr:unnamed protein product [Acanthoscelides obtectus]CAH1997656.1 unnamed protein product [Acanthoscelides obtectus]CAK1667178.1 hypothetical protein AOBTE_LOCUS25706 [Acanthoscelides obtectus]CAK1667216.1 hypothetical protein AOBTE_LOCUS25716 [Acanthoscelides obtectus]
MQIETWTSGVLVYKTQASPGTTFHRRAMSETRGTVWLSVVLLLVLVDHKRWQVTARAPLTAVDTWGGNKSAIDIAVRPAAIEEVSAMLARNNIKHEVMLDDVQRAINEENPTSDDDTNDRKGHRLTWQAYHKTAVIYGYLEHLTTTYPNLCSVKTIGMSVQNRPIKLLKISNGKPGNKAVWVDGGIHAREWITPATVTYIINHIVSNFENEPKYIQDTDWYITPVANPDGYEFTHSTDRLWRKNRARSGGQCAGTDLNRNFGYKWGGKGSSKNPCTQIYAGTGPFSEPETAAIQRFIQGTKVPWKAYVSFHSYGQYILYPWGYENAVPTDHRDLEAVGRRAAAAITAAGGPRYTVGPAGSTLYPAAGGSDDWAKGVAGFKYSYTIELRDTGRFGFVLPASYIQPTAEEALAALRVIVEAAQKA